MNDAGQYAACTPPPPPLPVDERVCFDLEYTDLKTGAEGCCPMGKPFSFDPVSREENATLKDRSSRDMLWLRRESAVVVWMAFFASMGAPANLRSCRSLPQLGRFL
jgi:hypothetical protein